MKLTKILSIVLFSILVSSPYAFATDDKIKLTKKIKEDYKDFFSKDSLKHKGYVFLSMAVVANTSIDENIREWYQNDIRSDSTDKWAKKVKNFGEGNYLIPLSLLASTAFYIDSDSKIGNWGLNSARAYAVGLPATLIMQKVVGASRPVTTSHSSLWRPFNDSYGLSGHAFVGAVPFLTIAKMNGDNKFIKYSAILASTLPAVSRINSDSHYFSQAALGWFMALESVNSVNNTNNKFASFTFSPTVINDAYGIGISATW